MTRCTQPHTECTVYVRGGERYVFLWRAEYAPELYRQFGRFASRGELSLTWSDAAVLTAKVAEYLRKEAK